MSEQPRAPAPFVVGAGRSGTTLLRFMLDAHPQVAIPTETVFLFRAAKHCADSRDARAAFLDAITAARRWPDFHLDEATLRRRVSDIEPFDRGSAVRLVYELYAARFGKPRWGDKTPQHVGRMEVVQDLLPEARFVHVIRDGRDVALSALEYRRLTGTSESIVEIARRWAVTVEDARRQAPNLRFYMELRYEDLVGEPERTLRRVATFVELPWDDAMLAYHERASERLSELVTYDPAKYSSAAQRRVKHAWTTKPPQPTRIGRWRKGLSVGDVRRFEATAGDVLQSLGYESS